ncbi:MAG: radical SAM protein [Firmicutes bacterium]|nr:radical SAM protein [Bacillota bacterium]
MDRVDSYEIEIAIVEHCNLNCAYCSYYSPLAKEGYLSPAALERDLKRIYEISGNKLRLVKLLGGEPTLHPRLIEMLATARKCLAGTKILLFTNGLTLNKMPDSFWGSLRDYNIGIISDKYSYRGFNEEKLMDAAAAKGINLLWTSVGPKLMDYFPLDLTGSQNGEENYGKCDFLNHNQLRDGRLYCCTTPPNIFHFNNYFGTELKVREKDSIGIHGDITHEDILAYLSKPIPFCRYCDKTRLVRESRWKVSERKIEEWS